MKNAVALADIQAEEEAASTASAAADNPRKTFSKARDRWYRRYFVSEFRWDFGYISHSRPPKTPRNNEK
jgi:hypothetical protein